MRAVTDSNEALEALRQELEDDIEIFISRYAGKNGMTPADAKAYLTSAELGRLNVSMYDFKKMATDKTLSPAAQAQQRKLLSALSARRRLTRLEGLEVQLRSHIIRRYGQVEQLIGGARRDVFTDGYYRSTYNVHKGLGTALTVPKITEADINAAVNVKIYGKTYYERLWLTDLHSKGLTEKVVKLVQTNMLTGESYDNLAAKLVKATDISKSQAENLTRTECAYFGEKAAAESYKALGTSDYEIIATLDNVTSEECRDQDGKVYPMDEFEQGVNAPPFHNKCRTTFAPALDEEDDEFFKQFDKGARVARLPGGKNKPVGDLTYHEWFNAFVK